MVNNTITKCHLNISTQLNGAIFLQRLACKCLWLGSTDSTAVSTQLSLQLIDSSQSDVTHKLESANRTTLPRSIFTLYKPYLYISKSYNWVAGNTKCWFKTQRFSKTTLDDADEDLKIQREWDEVTRKQSNYLPFLLVFLLDISSIRLF